MATIWPSRMADLGLVFNGLATCASGELQKFVKVGVPGGARGKQLFPSVERANYF